MRIFIRVLLTLYILCVLCVAVLAVVCAWNVIGAEYPLLWLNTLYTNTWTKILVTVIAFAFIVVSLVLMFARANKKEPKSALITQTGIGAVSISLSAIEDMATKHMLANDAVRNARVNVSAKEAKINLSCKLAVSEGTNIPEVLQAMQVSTKQEVETYAGVEIGKISMLVEKTSQVIKARVE